VTIATRSPIFQCLCSTSQGHQNRRIAIIGTLIGGKKEVLIGAGSGVTVGAIITAKQIPRNYPEYHRRN